LRPGQGGVPADLFNLADALILGNIGDDTSSFETSDSGFHLKKDMQAARLYVSGRSQAVMSPDAVIGLIDASEKGVRLTPFEKHILSFIDGRRPVESIRRQAGLDESEVKTALATLADKGVVKVVGRALADAADADVETAPGVGNKKKNPRRVRGTLVGAVVVVGDAADQAIEDAFRTQVRANSASLDLDDIDSSADIGEVFSSSDDGLPAAESGDIDSLGSFEGRRTGEILGQSPRVPTASKSTVRPSAQKEAVNARPRATVSNKTGGRLVIAEDPSDGFDDFGDASNLATAVVQQPSISEDSLPAGDASQERNNRRGGVFADGTNTGSRGVGARQPVAVRAPPAPPSNLSDLEDFDAPGLEGLADSRVEPRPVLQPQTPASLSMPSLSMPSLSSLSLSSSSMSEPSMSEPSMSDPLQPTAASTPRLANSEASLNDDERAAMTGGVWDEHSRPLRSSKGPGPSTHVGAPKEFSTSLSDLLGDDVPLVDSSEATAFRPPPAKMAAVVPEPPRSDPARTEIFESKLHAPKP
jgi:hypothetical protein